MVAPLYRTVYDEMRRRIQSGVYPPGTCLPAERKLIEEFAVSLITVRRAMDELVLDGVIERRQGRGSFVRERGRGVLVGMSSFTADVLDGRLRIVRTLLEDQMAVASEEVASRLGLQPGSSVRRLVRLDTEGGAPLSLDEAYIPPALSAFITPEIAGSPSFLDLWQKEAGLDLNRTDFEISAQPAGPRDEEALETAAESPLLVTRELIFTAGGSPAAWIVTRYRGDRTRLRGSFTLERARGAKGVRALSDARGGAAD
jgi:GntR family transcriptional regulator